MEHTPWKLFRFSKLHHWKVDTGNPDWFVDCGFDEEVAHKVAALPELLEAVNIAIGMLVTIDTVAAKEVTDICREARDKATGGE